MQKTKIGWADYVWNPTTGCVKVSEGCRNCYAEGIAKRFWKDRKFSDVMIHPERLDQPRHVNTPGFVFVDSMSDLFHPAIPVDFVKSVFNTMLVADHHKYVILTKRPENIHKIVEYIQTPNVIIGVSAEDQNWYNRRVDTLLNSGWRGLTCVSLEPLLGRIDLTHIEKLDWIIAGGESGTSARMCNPDWLSMIVEQAKKAGKPVFIKQMGAWFNKHGFYSDIRFEREVINSLLSYQEFPQG